MFGTDGIRDDEQKLLADNTAYKLGAALAVCIHTDCDEDDDLPPTVLIARDPRLSSPTICAALADALTTGGVQAADLGVLPTPALCALVPHYRAKYGVMVTASHNPPGSNGLKVVDANGVKLDETERARLETLIKRLSPPQGAPTDFKAEAADVYVNRIKAVARSLNLDLSGFRVILDCAHGCMCDVARAALEGFGGRVQTTFDCTDGERINLGCGATHPTALYECVKRASACYPDLKVVGIAFDGDGDRAIPVLPSGVKDGDFELLAIARLLLSQSAILAGDAVVVTELSNAALLTALRALKLHPVITQVGDAHVAQAMHSVGAKLGGEHSGHVIARDYLQTGDGLLTAVLLLSSLSTLGEPDYTPKKRLEINILSKDAAALLAKKSTSALLQSVRNALGCTGRLIARPSGTEPLLRLTLEGDIEDVPQELIDGLHALA